MNRIGSKNASVILAEKENIPPSSPPEWAIATKYYLLGTDLGAEWRGCVEGWIELEEILGYEAFSRSKARTFSCLIFEVLIDVSQAALPAIAS
jgi:hypothetical protein